MDGDVLAQVETDKATMDMDSAMSGYMAKIVVPAGTKDIPLGKVRMEPYTTFRFSIQCTLQRCTCAYHSASSPHNFQFSCHIHPITVHPFMYTLSYLKWLEPTLLCEIFRYVKY